MSTVPEPYTHKSSSCHSVEVCSLFFFSQMLFNNLTREKVLNTAEELLTGYPENTQMIL